MTTLLYYICSLLKCLNLDESYNKLLLCIQMCRKQHFYIKHEKDNDVVTAEV